VQIQSKPFVSVLGATSFVAAAALLVFISPWLHEDFFPYLGVGPSWDYALVMLTSVGIMAVMSRVVKAMFSLAKFDTEWPTASRHMPRQQVADEVREVAPYLEVMTQQLDGAVKETEVGVMALMEAMNAIHHVSDLQMQRIQDSDTSGSALTSALEEKVMVDKQLAMILQMFVDKQRADAELNILRIQRLREVKSLTPLVDVISNVARQTNFLAINAAVEAAHAGDTGRGFAVLAAEIRQLSSRTAEAAINISEKIKAATEGIDDEMRNATEVDDRNSASGSMQRVIRDIDEMQERFSAVSGSLLGVIEGVKTGHHEIIMQLSEAMGKIQFQDVIRQRVEQVQGAMNELNDHLQNMADQLVDKPWDPTTMVHLRERLEQQVSNYVMKSQLETHQTVTGKSADSGQDRPSIELF